MPFTIPDKMRGFLFNPSESFWKVADEHIRDSLLYFSLLAVIYALFSMLVSVGVFKHPFLSLFGLGFGLDFLLVKFLMAFIFPWLFALIYALLLHGWVYLLGGRKGIYQTIRSVLYSLTAFLLIGWIPDIGPLIGIFWCMVVGIIGIQELQQTSRSRAAIAVILSILTFLIVIFPLFWRPLIDAIRTGPKLISQY